MHSMILAQAVQAAHPKEAEVLTSTIGRPYGKIPLHCSTSTWSCATRPTDKRQERMTVQWKSKACVCKRFCGMLCTGPQHKQTWMAARVHRDWKDAYVPQLGGALKRSWSLM